MKLKVRDDEVLENKSIYVEVTTQYKFPLWFFEDDAGFVNADRDSLKSKIMDELERSLFSDSFGKIPATSFGLKAMDTKEIETLKEQRINELRAELTKLTGEVHE
jgi:hypothetical protein